MKIQIIVVALLVSVTRIDAQESQQGAANPVAATLEITSAQRPVPLDESKQLLVKFWFQQLMLSALYRDVVQQSSLDEWQQRLSSQSHLHCRYSAVAILAIPERRTLTFDEALLPLSPEHYPDYIFIKRGQQVLRLAKYDPWVLHKLMSESGLPFYASLSKVERGLF
jgi:hypothetical protein